MSDHQYWLWMAMGDDSIYWLRVASKSFGYWCAGNTPLLTGLITAYAFRHKLKRPWLMAPLIPILTYGFLIAPFLIYSTLVDLISVITTLFSDRSFTDIADPETMTDDTTLLVTEWLWQHWTYALPALLTPLSIAVSVFVVRRWEALEVVLRFPPKNTPAPAISQEI